MAIFKTVKLSELKDQHLMDEATKLREEIILREILDGNDCREDILKISELGVLKTLAGNKKLKIHQSGLMEDFIDLNMKGYNEKQKTQVRLGLLHGFDINPYLHRYFDYEQMAEIRVGIADGFDYQVYAKKEFDSDQMLQIRLCMDMGFDVSLIANPSIDSMQMQQIKDKIIRAFEYGVSYNIADIVQEVTKTKTTS